MRRLGIIILLAPLTLTVAGCEFFEYKNKYEELQEEHQELKARYETLRAENNALKEELDDYESSIRKMYE